MYYHRWQHCRCVRQRRYRLSLVCKTKTRPKVTFCFTGTLAAAAAASVFECVIVLDRDKLEVSVEILKQPKLEFESLSEVTLRLGERCKALTLPSSRGSDRQKLVQEAKQHRSVQQGLQMHGLLAGGGEAFERLLPGFRQQCVASGANYVADDVKVGQQISLVSREQENAQGKQCTCC